MQSWEVVVPHRFLKTNKGKLYKMSEELISIIVPVYNSESTLRRCIDSILAQTYQNFELLLIDDGSKDRSGDICDEYASADSRIRVFHKENGGVSSARNVGLYNARGERVMFCDSDDMIMTFALETLKASSNDLVIMSSICMPSQIIFQIKWADDNVTQNDIGDFYIKNMESPLLNAPWGKLFKRNKIIDHHLSFDENLHFGEDSIFVKQYLTHVDNIGLYNYIGHVYLDDGQTYIKYSKCIESVYEFCKKTIDLNQELSKVFSCNISSDNTIHVVYNITMEYLKKCPFLDPSLSLVKSFFKMPPVRYYLKKKKSVGMHILLFAGRYLPRIVLPIYGRLLIIHRR